MTTLYSKDSKGKVRVLNLWVKGDILYQSAGLLNGALVEHKKICKPKNIGKSNETTGEEQAKLMLDAKITEKLKGDYFLTMDEALTTVVILPMLAKEYKKEEKKINWSDPVYAQPKLDGMRCLALVKNGKVKLLSRTNTDIILQHNSMHHLIPELAKLPNGIYDGELYAHGYSFQENMELIKKYRKGKSELVKLHCYDFTINKPYSERYKIIKSAYLVNPLAFELVQTTQVGSFEDIKKIHAESIEKGFEGTIIRHGKTGYELNHRSSSLLKYKDHIDIVLPIKYIEPADFRPDWGVPVFEWKGAKDNELRAGIRFSHEMRQELLANKEKYIGKVAEVRFFEYSDTGVPRHPVMHGFRLDK